MTQSATVTFTCDLCEHTVRVTITINSKVAPPNGWAHPWRGDWPDWLTTDPGATRDRPDFFCSTTCHTTWKEGEKAAIEAAQAAGAKVATTHYLEAIRKIRLEAKGAVVALGDLVVDEPG